MKIKVKMDSVVTEATEEATARAIAERFSVIVSITGAHSPAGMEMEIICTPAQLVEMLTTDNGGWSTGDDAEDAEAIFYHMRDAVEVFG